MHLQVYKAFLVRNVVLITQCSKRTVHYYSEKKKEKKRKKRKVYSVIIQLSLLVLEFMYDGKYNSITALDLKSGDPGFTSSSLMTT